MEIPFYYSFKEFETNYENDFKNWLKDFPDADEKDYLFELKEFYAPFVRWSGNYRFEPTIRVSWIGETDYPEYGEISINEVAQYVERKIIIHCNNVGTLENENPERYIFRNNIDPFDYWESSNERTNDNSIYFEDEKFNYLKHFFTYDYSFLGFELDEKKYKNFGFSVIRIAEWIDEKILIGKSTNNQQKQPMNSEDTKDFLLGFYGKNNIESKGTPELLEVVESYNVKEKGQNIPYKIAMLDEMKVIETLNTQYTNTSEIIRILQFIIGGNIDNIEQYYNSIYGNTKTAKLKVTHLHRAKAKEIYFK